MKTKIKYCLPIVKKTRKEVLKALNIKGYDFYEIWLDYIKDLDNDFITQISKSYKGKLIFVFRRQNLEKIKLSFDKRVEIISLLSKFNIFLDLDFLTQYEELEYMQQKNIIIKLILSFHNYKETPSLDHLKNLINKMKRYTPAIFKVSTFCKEETDALNLLNLILILKAQKLKYIVLGMGEEGFITRIFGTIWGNEITFAPKTLSEKSAQGQLTKKQLEDIFSKILK
ncbi:type I 3-dehydroquinate dehydratase [Candidatus Daviesbacteria bacterium]|nr:type I 3-dehydroquinate dehydratase [Candidatus Daviesbacteria bacterium]